MSISILLLGAPRKGRVAHNFGRKPRMVLMLTISKLTCFVAVVKKFSAFEVGSLTSFYFLCRFLILNYKIAFFEILRKSLKITSKGKLIFFRHF